MHEVTAPPEPEIQVLWRERPAPPRKPKKKDYRLLRSRITNLILLGIICGFIYFRFFRNKNTLRAFAGSTGLYLLCCLAAEIINLSFDRLGTINMFYINPDYRMQQIIFHDLSFLIGNLPAIFLYIAATILGAFLLFLAWMLFARFFKH